VWHKVYFVPHLESLQIWGIWLIKGVEKSGKNYEKNDEVTVKLKTKRKNNAKVMEA